jgi:hypothetical protein
MSVRLVNLAHTARLLAAIALPASLAAQSASGTWSIELWLDSANAIGPRPTARFVQGLVLFDTLHVDSGVAGNGSRWTRRSWPGRFAIDLTPFFGGPIGRDVSTSIRYPFDEASATEVEAELDGDRLRLHFIPGVSHGGISLSGVVAADSMAGRWEMRAYCCGARGHFLMRRISRVPVAFVRPPPPPPPKPLAVDARVEVRVRLLNLATGRYFAGRHGLTNRQNGWIKCCYSTTGDSQGWGQFFWLPPGQYSVAFEEFDCAGRFASLRRRISQDFEGKAGDTVQITLRVNLDTVALSRTYDNLDSLPCRKLRSGQP